MVGEEGVDAIVTGLLRRGGGGLLVHRAYPALVSGCWDLPGGHIEDGETPNIALRRELVEELGVGATLTGPPDANFRGTTFHMAVWVIDEWEGEPTNRELAEHDAHRLDEISGNDDAQAGPPWACDLAQRRVALESDGYLRCRIWRPEERDTQAVPKAETFAVAPAPAELLAARPADDRLTKPEPL